MQKFCRKLSKITFLFVVIFFLFTFWISSLLPDQLNVTRDDAIQFNILGTLNISAQNDTLAVNSSLNSQAGPGKHTQLYAYGLIPLKTTKVNVVEREYVIPSGVPCGIKMYTDGVMVVGMSEVDAAQGAINPAKEAGIQMADIIVSIDGSPVKRVEDVAHAFENSQGQTVTVHVLRGDVEHDLQFTPVMSASQNRYKAGLWVRDSSAGIGTMTFYNPKNNVFGGLGHAICDVDTGEKLPFLSGKIVAATITGYTKGSSGAPGELNGIFIEDETLGTLRGNEVSGIYGEMNTLPAQKNTLPVAFKQEISLGPAQILSTIEGSTPKFYDIEIIKINFNSESTQKNMVVKITDPELLEKTGGIIQGMSGSPIIQNGMLAGAVTHVFVNNPTQGYAIFAENMITSAKNVVGNSLAKAS